MFELTAIYFGSVDFMNIEAYNLDSLRRLVRSLQDENKRLKEQLDKANIPYVT